MADVPIDDVPVISKATLVGFGRLIAAVISGLFLSHHIHLDQYVDSPTLIGGIVAITTMISSAYSKYKHKKEQALREVVALNLPTGSTVPELNQQMEEIKTLGNK